MKFFAEISKVEENSDGTLSVEGIASTEAVDSDGEVVKAAAIEAALPDFMRYGTGNLREMHQPLAAGTIDKAEVIDGKTIISATVVDPIAITKVKASVYKGFSIGGKVTERDLLNKKEVTGVKLVEISLVDRPANPEAVISMWKFEDADEAEGQPIEKIDEPSAETQAVSPNKGDDFEQVWRSNRDGSVHLKKADLIAHHKAIDDATAVAELNGDALGKLGEIEAIAKREFSTEERKDDAKSGKALPDGSFPIENESDLENAIHAYGRAKNKAAAKRHIIRRARALGATDKLPEGWTKKAEEGADLEKSISLYDISNLAQLLASLQWAEESLETDIVWPTAVNATPELKNRFGAILVELGDIIATCLDEVLASIKDEEAAEAMQRGDMAVDIMKAGARHFRSDMADLQAAHDALVKLGADCGMEKGAHTDDLTKVNAADQTVLQKAYDQISERLDEVLPMVKGMKDHNDALEKRIRELEAQPTPPKTVGAHAISKETDTIGVSAEPVITKADALKLLEELSPDERALALIKVAHGKPYTMSPRA